VLVGLAVLSLWEAAARFGLVPTLYMPAPSEVAVALWTSILRGELGSNLWATLTRVVPGLMIGVVPGLLLGVAMGRSPSVRRVVDPFIAALHPIPKIALLPLLMIVLGIGEASRIAVVAIAAFFPMLINAMAGVRRISPLYFEVARNYGASRRKVFTRVVLPGSLPMVLSGLRLSANVAFLVTIAVEIVAADSGLGALIWLSWEVLRVELLYAVLVVIALFGVTLNLGLGGLAIWLAPWQATADEAG
jgi:NitT/TauT family transport system permease protein